MSQYFVNIFIASTQDSESTLSQWTVCWYESINRCYAGGLSSLKPSYLLACLLPFIVVAAKAFDPEKARAGFELSSYFSRQHKQRRVYHSTVQLCALAPQGIQDSGFQDFLLIF